MQDVIDAETEGGSNRRGIESAIEKSETAEYNSFDEGKTDDIHFQQKNYVENAPCVTTPKKYYAFFLKEGAEHANEFFNVGYTPTDVMQLRYDMAKQFDMSKAYDVKTDVQGHLRFSIDMELGIDRIRTFQTVWCVDTSDGKPRIITSHRKGSR